MSYNSALGFVFFLNCTVVISLYVKKKKKIKLSHLRKEKKGLR